MIYRTIYKLKPACFNLFPPEIRNKIYEFALLDEKPVLRLRRTRDGTENTWSLLTFANGNKLLYTELRPLIFQDRKACVRFQEYSAFVDSFYSHSRENTRPCVIQTHIEEEGSVSRLEWDMHALLLAKETTPGFQLELSHDPTDWGKGANGLSPIAFNTADMLGAISLTYEISTKSSPSH